jgi:hypothetical protein
MHCAPALFLALAVLGCRPAGAPRATIGEEEEPAAVWRSLPELERSFKARCSSRVPDEPDHCACAWHQARRTLDEREMNAWGDNPSKLALLRTRIARMCVTRRADAASRAAFVERCAGDDARFVSYCECAYGELRKALSPGEIDDAARRRDERFARARARVNRICDLEE